MNTEVPAEAPADECRQSSLEPEQAPAAPPMGDQNIASGQDAPPAEGELLIDSASYV